MGFEFVRDPPVRVRELAAALEMPMGALFRDGDEPLMGFVEAGGVQIDFWWDMFHENPVSSVEVLADKRMDEYSVRFDRGRDECEAALQHVYGPPQAKQRPSFGDYRQYGPFFVDAGEGDAFTLEWYASEPDWAKPAVDPAVRADVVRAFAVAVAVGEIEAAIGALPAGVGMAERETYGQDSRLLEFEPPMPAMACVDALGVRDAVAITTDVHMSSWRVEVPLGGVQLWALLDGWPSGDSVAGSGGLGGKRLGDADTVRYLELKPS